MSDFELLKDAMIGILEVLKQYPENLQPKVFDILVTNYLGAPALTEQAASKAQPVQPAVDTRPASPPKNPAATSPSKKKPAGKESFQLIKDLDLWGGDGKQPFKDFLEAKGPTSNIEVNVVAIYYLTRILGLSSVNVDHLYTCYKTANRRLPGNLKSSVNDTASSRYGYIDGQDRDNLKLVVRGENFVEHELPKKAKTK
jgi:hypothetical protein